jgi:hypothetical protein
VLCPAISFQNCPAIITGPGNDWTFNSCAARNLPASSVCVLQHESCCRARPRVRARVLPCESERQSSAGSRLQEMQYEKSRLEHHLTALLPFGGGHADALTNLQTMAPKRLARNARLHRELAHGRGATWNRSEGGLLIRQMTLPMGGELEKLFEFIPKGLLWHHWKVRLTDDHTVVASLVPDDFLDPYSKVPPDRRVNVSLGGGTVSYQGLQGDDYPEVSHGNSRCTAVWKSSTRPSSRRALTEQSVRPPAISGLLKKPNV